MSGPEEFAAKRSSALAKYEGNSKELAELLDRESLFRKESYEWTMPDGSKMFTPRFLKFYHHAAA